MSTAELVRNRGRMAALTRRDFAIERSYRFRVLTSFSQLMVAILITHQISELVVDRPELEPYGGSYFDFVIVGLATMSVATVGVGTFTSTIVREQSLGTFEVLLATPTPVWVLLSGSFAFPLALTVIELVLYIGVGLGIVGSGIDIVGLLIAIPIIALLLLSFCAIGIIGAAIAPRAEAGQPARCAGLDGDVNSQRCGVSGVHPAVGSRSVRSGCSLRTTASTRTRDALLGGGDWSSVAGDALALVLFDLALVPIALWAFGAALRSARRTGTIANY